MVALIAQQELNHESLTLGAACRFPLFDSNCDSITFRGRTIFVAGHHGESRNIHAISTLFI
jgi:hypothetical protein